MVTMVTTSLQGYHGYHGYHCKHIIFQRMYNPEKVLTVVDKESAIVGLDYLTTSNGLDQVIWGELNHHSIRSAGMDGSNKDDIVRQGTVTIVTTVTMVTTKLLPWLPLSCYHGYHGYTCHTSYNV
eukprot:sb/3475655/